MATAAAIDRVVHNFVILEFDVPSCRTGAARQRRPQQEVNRQGWLARDITGQSSLFIRLFCSFPSGPEDLHVAHTSSPPLRMRLEGAIEEWPD